MAARHPNVILVSSRTPPTVEIDTGALAAYVRFKRVGAKVTRTLELSRPGAIVTIDYDREDEVIGIELLGVREFSIGKLLQKAQVQTPNIDLNRARYVGAGRALAAVG
jgi:uncharacterized protein YuzE